MRVSLTKQQVIWLADLAKKAKEQADLSNNTTPNPIFELRRDNMADLETALKRALQRQNQRE